MRGVAARQNVLRIGISLLILTTNGLALGDGTQMSLSQATPPTAGTNFFSQVMQPIQVHRNSIEDLVTAAFLAGAVFSFNHVSLSETLTYAGVAWVKWIVDYMLKSGSPLSPWERSVFDLKIEETSPISAIVKGRKAASVPPPIAALFSRHGISLSNKAMVIPADRKPLFQGNVVANILDGKELYSIQNDTIPGPKELGVFREPLLTGGRLVGKIYDTCIRIKKSFIGKKY